MSTDAANEARLFNDRGNALLDVGQFEEALANYDRALSIRPESAVALTNRSNVFRALHRLDDALSDLDTALGIRPAFPEALNNRGNVLRDMRRLSEALASFEAALQLRPDFVLALCNRGHTLLDLGRTQEALSSFAAVLALVPDDGEALFGRAVALLNLRVQLEEAVTCFDRAAAVDKVECLVGKAAALAQLKRPGEAAACLAEVMALAPDRSYVLGSLIYSRLQALDWSDYDSLVETLIQRLEAGRKATFPLSLLPVADSPELSLASARIYVQDQFPAQDNLLCAPASALASASATAPEPVPASASGLTSASASAAAPASVPAPASELAFAPAPTPAPIAQGLIRIAYVSADFRDHPVSHLLVGVLEQHDRRRFEVIGVSLRPRDDSEIGRRVVAAFDRFIDVEARSDRDIAELLRELQVDIAVDLMGFTDGCRLGIFAHRAAPVQVSYLGYPGTSGAPYIDYLLADDVVIPHGAEGWYTEKVVRLPRCVLPNDDQRRIEAAPSREAAGLPAHGFVFCAFTNAYKINPAVFDFWMRVLREIPGSVLWLRDIAPAARDRLLQEAVSRGVQASRLVFAPHVLNMAEHLGRHRLADLYLDTFPYNAHSTACDALWAGVPVLTCTGRTYAARAAASALTTAGLTELITKDLQEYESRAVQLAREPERLRALRQRLAEQRSPLFDTAGYCRHLEDAFAGML